MINVISTLVQFIQSCRKQKPTAEQLLREKINRNTWKKRVDRMMFAAESCYQPLDTLKKVEDYTKLCEVLNSCGGSKYTPDDIKQLIVDTEEFMFRAKWVKAVTAEGYIPPNYDYAVEFQILTDTEQKVLDFYCTNSALLSYQAMASWLKANNMGVTLSTIHKAYQAVFGYGSVMHYVDKPYAGYAKDLERVENRYINGVSAFM